MGTYLSTPVTEKCEESGEDGVVFDNENNDTENDDTDANSSSSGNKNKNAEEEDKDVPVEWGVVDMQGWRKSMEDAHTAVTRVPVLAEIESGRTRNARVFGVYDGHGGPEVARFCQHYFVSVLVNQPTWIEHNANAANNGGGGGDANAGGNKRLLLPVRGDDDRVPAPPPIPVNDPFDGTGNEPGYRSAHLPVAIETPVGKSLRQAFHALDRMINDPNRRNEIGALRAAKPAPGATKTLERGPDSIPPQPCSSSSATPPDFYLKHNPPPPPPAAAASPATSTACETEDDSGNTGNPNNQEENDGSSSPASAAANEAFSEEEKEEHNKRQLDKSLSMVLSPQQAQAVVKQIEEFEENNPKDGDQGKEKKKDDDSTDSVDSNVAAGLEEAAELDQNIEDDNDDDKDCDSAATGSAKEGGEEQPAPPPSQEEGEKKEETPAATPTKTNKTTPSGRKVTTMLQKILSFSGASAPSSSENNGKAEKAAPPPSTAAAAATAVPLPPNGPGSIEYPNTSTVSGVDARHPSVIHNGRLVCNLPDHPVHAGATAVVAVLTGRILTVANAGDSRAVLCRRRRNNQAGSSAEAGSALLRCDDCYAYPLSYDHKPQQTHEMNRILRSGGFVNHFGRINGNLNLSRSIGDLKYKQVPGIPPHDQMITAEPDVMQICLLGDDEFLILGCDGIWDCLSNEQAVNFVAARIDSKSPTEIGREMLDEIISDDPRVTQGIGGDNMTVMIIDLQSSNRSRRKNSGGNGGGDKNAAAAANLNTTSDGGDIEAATTTAPATAPSEDDSSSSSSTNSNGPSPSPPLTADTPTAAAE